MSNELTIIERNGEPTVWASDLAARIGMQRNNVQRFITKHAVELKELGEIVYSLRERAQATGFGQRQVEFADWQLNEGQAAYLATQSGTAAGRTLIFPTQQENIQ